jgi:hypothetical protein
MQAIILDPELRAKLSGLERQLELRDESGTTLGLFVPLRLYEEMISAWTRLQFADEQEREQARREIRNHGGLSTAEATAHLEQVARGARTAS